MSSAALRVHRVERIRLQYVFDTCGGEIVLEGRDGDVVIEVFPSDERDLFADVNAGDAFVQMLKCAIAEHEEERAREMEHDIDQK